MPGVDVRTSPNHGSANRTACPMLREQALCPGTTGYIVRGPGRNQVPSLLRCVTLETGVQPLQGPVSLSEQWG